MKRIFDEVWMIYVDNIPRVKIYWNLTCLSIHYQVRALWKYYDLFIMIIEIYSPLLT